MAEQWKYLQLTGAATGETSAGGRSLADDPIFRMLTSQVGVKPGTHQYLRVDEGATLQGQTVPFYQQLIDQGIASEVDETTFKDADNFHKKTIGAQDLVGANPQM
jgi:hypothetical protein